MKGASDGHREISIFGRRKFLQSGALSAMGGAVAAARAPRNRPDEQARGAAGARPNVRPFELEEMTITELQRRMKSGEFTARSLTEKYLARIEEIDKRGPAINAIIELNPDALSIATALDEERKARGPRSSLHGVPVVIKDNIGTHDRMMTTAGSLALLGSVPPRDSFVARRLREAGAVILGKANLSEWAEVRSHYSTAGWSSRGGQTRNPYVLDRNPGGSSSGSAAAVAANLAAVALGTETDSSIVCPSSMSCLVGIKTTVGLVSRSGVIPISHSQDTVGPMARTVTDATIVLGVLAAVDPEDTVTQNSRGRVVADYTQFLQASGLKGARIGVARKHYEFGEEVEKLMQNAIDAMRHAGAEVIDPADIPTLGQFEEAEGIVLLYELKAGMNAYLSGLGPSAPVHSLKEIIEFNEKNWQREMPYFGQDRFLKAESYGPLTTPEYLEALEKSRRLARTEGVDAVMAKFRLDAIMAPTTGPAWVIDLVNGDHEAGQSSRPAAVSGYPNINVPAGYVFGLPVGISFFSKAYSEPALIRIAYAFEQTTQHRRSPQFLPTADLTV
jgi:amidase